MDIFLVILFSYISGSIPFGLILTKTFGNIDLRKIGSGNIGATNVLRTGNKFLGYSTLLLDILKAVLPIIYVKLNYPEFIYICSLSVFLGHVFPIWLKFKGGKGVATYVGMLIILNYFLGIVFGIVWVIIGKCFWVFLVLLVWYHKCGLIDNVNSMRPEQKIQYGANVGP